MRYWPFNAIAQHPMMPAFCIPELSVAYRSGITRMTEGICADVAGYVKPCSGPLVVVETVGSPARRVYLDYPEADDWFRLERGGFNELPGGQFGFILDALH